MGGSLKDEIHRETAALGANLVVIPKGSCGYEQLSILTGDQMPTNISAMEIASTRGIQVLTVVPFLAQQTAINNKPVTVSGIEPAATLSFKRWQISQGSYFRTPDKPAWFLAPLPSRMSPWRFRRGHSPASSARPAMGKAPSCT
jgi:putative ABC transport system permease protein